MFARISELDGKWSLTSINKNSRNHYLIKDYVYTKFEFQATYYAFRLWPCLTFGHHEIKNMNHLLKKGYTKFQATFYFFRYYIKFADFDLCKLLTIRGRRAYP